MLESSVNTNFISEKVAKIRFCPEEYSEVSSFVTGSYDLPKNSIKFWRMDRNDMVDEEQDYVPKSKATLPLNADVTGLEFLDFNNFGVTTSDGNFALVYINRDKDENNLKENIKHENLHRFNCTGLSAFDEDVVTVGEDGVWHLLATNQQRVIRSNKNADSCGISTVCFVNRKELITGNSLGVLKIFDTLQATDKPQHTLQVSCEDEKRCNRVMCLTFHPTQQFQLLAGTEEGSLTIFDLRKPDTPASYLSAHSTPINEIGFHRTDPSKLFTAAENGELWMWTQNMQPVLGMNEASTEAPWLNGERAKSDINVTALLESRCRMAINSFDTFRNKVIASGDMEAVYLIDQVY
ncbi:nucleoporin Nup43 [Culicoides brevitarsis]|uniref:nucleoporin Nup43 n=1 Tax=Culicoides brevitarsis TaxID=469753 RepID=UPI00307C336A